MGRMDLEAHRGLLKEAVWIVDWYHALEHVWAAAACCTAKARRNPGLGEGVGNACCGTGRCGRSWPAAWRSGAHASPGQARGVAGAARTYVENQDARLAYDRFRRGLDIGSGQVESACNHVVACDEARQHALVKGGLAKRAVAAGRLAQYQWDRLWATHPLAAAA